MSRERNGAVPSSVSSRLSPSQMRHDVLPARRALKSSCPQGHLPAGLGASLNPALNLPTPRKGERNVSRFQLQTAESFHRSRTQSYVRENLTPNAPIFRRKHEILWPSPPAAKPVLTPARLYSGAQAKSPAWSWQATAKGRRTRSSRLAPGRTFRCWRETVGGMISAGEGLLQARSDAGLLGRRSSVYPMDLGQEYA